MHFNENWKKTVIWKEIASSLYFKQQDLVIIK